MWNTDVVARKSCEVGSCLFLGTLATVLGAHHCGGGAACPVSERHTSGHAGRPKSGLHEQAPRAAAPFLSVRRHWRTAAAGSLAGANKGSTLHDSK